MKRSARHEHVSSVGGAPSHVLDFGDMFGAFLVAGIEEGCPDCEKQVADQLARSTLQLLSRFAVFMWMEAEAHRMLRWSQTYSETPRGRDECRLYAFEEAVTERGLFRVDWGRP